jgi:hypothetical protein
MKGYLRDLTAKAYELEHVGINVKGLDPTGYCKQESSGRERHQGPLMA